jgi:hypothetical protein
MMEREYDAAQFAGHATSQETSQSYIGRWNRLVSTTNWEKGRIIFDWRSALIAERAAVVEYSDEAWSRLVGGVTGQHAGRLRRVYERFGDIHLQFEGLYWSHFQAALDWEDAEMWLEGALQSQWSVAEMRRRRWQTMGGLAEDEPREDQIVAAEVDEDFAAQPPATAATVNSRSELYDEGAVSEARSPAGPDFGDDQDVSAGSAADARADVDMPAQPQAERARPFADLPELPADLAAAFESFQLAILRQRAGGWQEISPADVLASLEALKSLVISPV